jgi:protein phosphatase
VAVAVLVGAVFLGWRIIQDHYYVGTDRGSVAIYKGVQQSIGPIALSDVYEDTDISVSGLPDYTRENVRSTINAQSLDDAREIVERLRKAAATGQDQAGTGGDGSSPSPTPSSSSTGSPSPSPGAKR